MYMETIKIAFMGAGDIFTLHAEGIAQAANTEIVGIWNRTKAKATAKAEEYQIPTVYDTPEELFADPNVDAVFIITNMETHIDYSIAALEAGKHVLVEKPVADNLPDIQRLQDVVAKTGLICAPVHNYIYEPSLIRAKDMIDRGVLGDICAVYVMYNIHHPEEVCSRYPGVIRQILTHHSYISLYLMGTAPTTVSCMRATINDGSVPQENIAMATLQFPSGTLGHLCASFASDDHAGDPWTCMVKVIGSKGSTRFSYRDWVENKPAVVHSQTYSAYPYSIRNVGIHFIENCLRKGEQPLSTIADALTCQKLIEACETSAIEGKHIQLS